MKGGGGRRQRIARGAFLWSLGQLLSKQQQESQITEGVTPLSGGKLALAQCSPALGWCEYWYLLGGGSGLWAQNGCSANFAASTIYHYY